MRAFESASASKRRARRSFSDTIAAPSPSPWKAGATMPSAKTSAKGGSASTLRKPQSSPLGDSTTAKSRSRSTPGAVQRPRSQSASMTGTPMNATHSSFAESSDLLRVHVLRGPHPETGKQLVHAIRLFEHLNSRFFHPR